MRINPANQRWPIVWFIGILLSGVFISLLLMGNLQNSNESEINRLVEKQAQELAERIERQFRLFQYGLRGVRGHVLSEGENDLTKESFRRYSLIRDIDTEFPGARGFGMIRRVTVENEQAYVDAMRQKGDPDFSIRFLNKHNEDRYVIEFIEPLSPNDSALGLDIGSEVARRSAAYQALKTGEVRITAPITLVQAQGKSVQSFLILMPIYNSWKTPDTELERLQQGIGWSYAPLVTDEIMAELNLDLNRFTMKIFDISNLSSPFQFYSNENGTEAMYPHDVELNVFGRTWKIQLSVTPEFVEQLHQNSPQQRFVWGLVVSLGLAVLAYLIGINQDTKERRLEFQRKLASVVENSVDAIISTTLMGKITTWNTSAKDLFGKTANQVVGLNIADLGLSASQEYIVQDALLNAHKGIVTQHVELFLLTENKSKKHVMMSAVPIKNQFEKVVSISFVFRDISDIKQFQDRLFQAKERAEKASLAKSQFLANMSHELRTPMNASLGMLNLLKSTELTAQQLDYATKAEFSAKSLLKVINEILDFSKIEAGKTSLDEHEFELEELISYLSILLSAEYANHSVEVAFNIDPKVPLVLVGDLMKITQVMTNLVSNAVKFTSAGHVLISISCLKQTDHLSTVKFEVEDTGIGIAKQKIKHIFDSFAQGETSTSRRFGGTGLGLTISQKLVEIMGGELRVSSQLGKGSRFFFTLDLGNIIDNPYLPVLQNQHTCRRILIVEDSTIMAEMLSHTLINMGYEADTVYRGGDAIDCIENGSVPYDLILMDWDLPDSDGVEVSRIIKQRVSDPPKIIIITAHENKMVSKHSVSREGYDLLLNKPVTPKTLFKSIQEVCSNIVVEEQVTTEQRPISSRLHDINILVVEDNDLNRQVISELLTLYGANVTLAEGGTEAIELMSGSDEFDVILMDIQMPDLDGYSATKQIRTLPNGAKIPIIALTANASEQDRATSLKSGMQAHVGKPVDIEELVGVINWSLKESSFLPASKIKSNQSGQMENKLTILRRFGDNYDLVVRMTNHYKDEVKKQLDLFDQATDDNNIKTMLAALHSLKGVAATMGATELATFLQVSEDRVASLDLTPDEISSIREQLDRLYCSSVEQLKAYFFDQKVEKVAPLQANLTALEISKIELLIEYLDSRNLAALELASELNQEYPDNKLIAKAREWIELLDYSNAVRYLKQEIGHFKGQSNDSSSRIS